MAPGCIVGQRTGGVILWAMFSWDTLGPIIQTAQSLTAVRYRNIVADQVHPFTATVFLAGDSHYQRDNAARIVKERFEEHDNKFMLMPWPPNSPDMNPIEKWVQAITTSP